MTGNGQPPKGGFAGLVPELLVEDIKVSLRFWMDGLGFTIAYQRAEEKFAYLERPEGAQIMLCQRHGGWETGPLEPPFGRGVMFQIYVASVDTIERQLSAIAIPLYAGPREVWRNLGDRQGGMREIFVLDPNGYLIMVAEKLGERPLRP